MVAFDIGTFIHDHEGVFTDQAQGGQGCFCALTDALQADDVPPGVWVEVALIRGLSKNADIFAVRVFQNFASDRLL